MLLVELERSEEGRNHVDFHRSHFLSFCRAPGLRLICYIQIHYTDLYRFFNTLSSFSPFGPVFPGFSHQLQFFGPFDYTIHSVSVDFFWQDWPDSRFLASPIAPGVWVWYTRGVSEILSKKKGAFCLMKLNNVKDVEKFIQVVNECKHDVYLKSLEGDVFNLKSSMSRYVAIGRLIEESGDSLELFATSSDDEALLINFLFHLDENNQ